MSKRYYSVELAIPVVYPAGSRERELFGKYDYYYLMCDHKHPSRKEAVGCAQEHYLFWRGEPRINNWKIYKNIEVYVWLAPFGEDERLW